jgi:biotin operon repressor
MGYQMDEISEKQKQVLDLIIRFTMNNGFQPNREELAQQTGTTRQAVSDKIKQLCRKGVLEISVESGERCMRIVGMKFEPVFDAGKVPKAHAKMITELVRGAIR